MNKHFNILQPVSNPVGMKQDEDENVCVYYPSIEGFLVPDPNGYFSAEYILGGIFPAPDAGFEHLFDSQSLSTPYGNTGGFTSADGRFYTNDELAKEAWAHREARHQALEQGDFNIIEVIAALNITQRINNEIAKSGGGMMYHGAGFNGDPPGGELVEEDIAKFFAITLRSSPFEVIPGTGIGPMGLFNQFYEAEAISGDIGGLFVGAEKDWRGFFILVEKDIGKFLPYSGLAGGGGSEASAGFEYSRIDYTGNPSDFQTKYLFGFRNKVWIGAGAFIGGSIGFAWNKVKGNYIFSTSISFGGSLSPWIISAGYNYGEIR